MALLGVLQQRQLPRYIQKSLKSPSPNNGKIPGRTSMKYKAIKIVHAELLIPDNLLIKLTEKEDAFFFFNIL